MRLKNKTVHTTFELWQAALQDPILAPIMQGVYPRYKLPIVNKYPSGLIANTDPHDKLGTHWVAMYFICPWKSEFLTAMCLYLFKCSQNIAKVSMMLTVSMTVSHRYQNLEIVKGVRSIK